MISKYNSIVNILKSLLKEPLKRGSYQKNFFYLVYELIGKQFMAFVEDESVQSWIYRNLFLSGAIDYSSVIGINSLWRENPHFTAECDVDFKTIDDRKLINFLRMSNIAHNKADTFDDPTEYITDAKFVLYKGYSTPNSKGTISIGYCSYCIVDSITKHGFGYFKASWLNQNKCNIHNVALDFVPISKRTSGLKIIRDVISGKKLREQGLPVIRKKSSNRITSDDFVMPCLVMEFYRVASSRWSNIFPWPSFMSFYLINGQRKSMGLHALQIKYLTYSIDYPAEFKRFINERSEIITIKLGINQKLSLSENLLKSKNYNCSKCHNLSINGNCVVSPILVQEYLNINSPLELNIKSNLCGYYSPDHYYK